MEKQDRTKHYELRVVNWGKLSEACSFGFFSASLHLQRKRCSFSTGRVFLPWAPRTCFRENEEARASSQSILVLGWCHPEPHHCPPIFCSRSPGHLVISGSQIPRLLLSSQALPLNLPSGPAHLSALCSGSYWMWVTLRCSLRAEYICLICVARQCTSGSTYSVEFEWNKSRKLDYVIINPPHLRILPIASVLRYSPISWQSLFPTNIRHYLVCYPIP